MNSMPFSHRSLGANISPAAYHPNGPPTQSPLQYTNDFEVEDHDYDENGLKVPRVRLGHGGEAVSASAAGSIIGERTEKSSSSLPTSNLLQSKTAPFSFPKPEAINSFIPAGNNSKSSLGDNRKNNNKSDSNNPRNGDSIPAAHTIMFHHDSTSSQPSNVGRQLATPALSDMMMITKGNDSKEKSAIKVAKFCIPSELPGSLSDDVKESLYVPQDWKGKNINKIVQESWKLQPPNMILSCHSGMRHPRNLATASLCDTDDFAEWRDQAVKQIMNSEKRSRTRMKHTSKRNQVKKTIADSNMKAETKQHPFFKYRSTDSGFSSSDTEEEIGDDEFAFSDDEFVEQIDLETSDTNNEEKIISKLLFERLLRMYVSTLDACDKANNWILIDRASDDSSAAAELLIEYALQRTTSRPVILVIDSLERLEKSRKVVSQHPADGGNELISSCDGPALVSKILENLKDSKEYCHSVFESSPYRKIGKFASEEFKEFAYQPTDFDDYRRFVVSDCRDLPFDPEALDVMQGYETRLHEKKHWSYFYRSFIYGSGTHYIFVEKKGNNVPKTFGPYGYLFSAGGNREHKLIKRTVRSGKPTLIINNTGGLTQAFATLRKAMVYHFNSQKANSKLPVKLELSDILSYLQIHCNDERWAYEFGAPDIDLCTEVLDRAEYIFRRIILELDVCNDSAEEMLSVMTGCFANAGSDGIPELGLGKAETNVVINAWQRHFLLIENAFSFKKIAGILYFSITFTAFLTTVASVFYGNLSSMNYLDEEYKDWYAENLTYAIVMLPILAGFLAALLNKGSYESKWKWAMMGGNQIVSEIYKFRSKTSPYRDVTAEQIKMEEEMGNIIFDERDKFTDRITSIFKVVMDSDVGSTGSIAFDSDYRASSVYGFHDKNDGDDFFLKIREHASKYLVLYSANNRPEREDETEKIKTKYNKKKSFLFKSESRKAQQRDKEEIKNRIERKKLFKKQREERHKKLTKMLEERESAKERMYQKSIRKKVLSDKGKFSRLSRNASTVRTFAKTIKRNEGNDLNLVRKSDLHLARKSSHKWKTDTEFHLAGETLGRVGSMAEAAGVGAKTVINTGRRASLIHESSSTEGPHKNDREFVNKSDSVGGLNRRDYTLIYEVFVKKGLHPNQGDDGTEETSSVLEHLSKELRTEITPKEIKEYWVKNGPAVVKRVEWTDEHLERLYECYTKFGSNTFSNECNRALSALAQASFKDIDSVREMWEAKEVLYIQRTIDDFMRDRDRIEKKDSSDSEEDYLGIMSIESYIKFRAIPLTSMFQKMCPATNRTLHNLELIAFIFTSFGALLAIVNQAQWVAITVAIGSSVEAYIQHSSMRAKRDTLNRNLTELQNLLTWWDGLTLVDRRTLSVKEHAVDVVETCYMNLMERITGLHVINDLKDPFDHAKMSMEGGKGDGKGVGKKAVSMTASGKGDTRDGERGDGDRGDGPGSKKED